MNILTAVPRAKNPEKKISFGCVVKETAEIAGFPRQAIIFVSIVAMITDTRLSRMAGNAIFKNSNDNKNSKEGMRFFILFPHHVSTRYYYCHLL